MNSGVFSALLSFMFSLASGIQPQVPMSLIVPTLVAEHHCVCILLKSLEQCTVLPIEIIIVASSAEKNKTIGKLKKCITNFHVLNITLVLFKEKLHQADARNVGVNLSKQLWISFFDGDDYLHPQRFEILQYMMEKNPHVHLFLHDYREFFQHDPFRIQNINVTDINIVLDPFTITKKYLERGNEKKFIHELFNNVNFANGWGTMTRMVFLKVNQWTEKFNLQDEDSRHNRDIVLKGFNVMVFDAVLGYYRKIEGSCKFIPVFE